MGRDPSPGEFQGLGLGWKSSANSRVDPSKSLSQTHQRQRAFFDGCGCALLVTGGVRSTCKGAQRPWAKRRNGGSRAESQTDEIDVLLPRVVKRSLWEMFLK